VSKEFGAFPVLSLPIVNAATVGSNNGTWYMGYSMGGSAASQVRVREGSATGKIIDSIWGVAGGSSSVVFPHPVYVDGKIYVEVVTGSPEGTIRWK